jgi:anti-sigma-K factor RskA
MNQPNEQLKETAAAYVLGALPELEIQAFRKDVMRDCELGRYVESLESVGDVLLASAPEVDVPDSLGMAIMAEARRDLEVADLITSPRAGQAAPASRGRWSWVRKPAVGFAAAAVLIVAAFGIGQSIGGNDQPAAPTVASSSFEAGKGSEATGKVVPISGGEEGAVVKVAGLEPNIGSDVYELWIARGDKVTRSSLFSVNSKGVGVSAVPENISDADAVMITREPAGGSEQPTSDVLATAKI